MLNVIIRLRTWQVAVDVDEYQNEWEFAIFVQPNFNPPAHVSLGSFTFAINVRVCFLIHYIKHAMAARLILIMQCSRH